MQRCIRGSQCGTLARLVVALSLMILACVGPLAAPVAGAAGTGDGWADDVVSPHLAFASLPRLTCRLDQARSLVGVLRR